MLFSMMKKRSRMKMRKMMSTRRKKRRTLMSMNIQRGQEHQMDIIRKVVAAVGFIAMLCRTTSTQNRYGNAYKGPATSSDKCTTTMLDHRFLAAEFPRELCCKDQKHGI